MEKDHENKVRKNYEQCTYKYEHRIYKNRNTPGVHKYGHYVLASIWFGETPRSYDFIHKYGHYVLASVWFGETSRSYGFRIVLFSWGFGFWIYMYKLMAIWFLVLSKDAGSINTRETVYLIYNIEND